MARLLLIFSIFLAGSCWATCIILNCPPAQISSHIQCTNCSSCLEHSQRPRHSHRFCVSKKDHTCGCASAVPPKCTRTAQDSSEVFTYCYIPEPASLPQPNVRPEGSLALSVVVHRFFSQPQFETRNPNNLVLITRFFTPGTAKCRDLHSIQAQRRSDKECIFRVKLAMPGIDHKTDDHYYYDDGTDLEANFSLEMFEGAKEVEFWTEVTLQHDEQITGDRLSFYSLARSPILRHILIQDHTAGNYTEAA